MIVNTDPRLSEMMLLLSAFITQITIVFNPAIRGRWDFGFYVCLIWTGSDVMLSTASIMHLCAIALYRYRGIAHPLHVRSSRQGRHVVGLVASTWCIALALSIPFIVQGVLDPSHVLQRIESNTVKNQSIIVESDSRQNQFESSQTKIAFYECGIFNQTFAIYSSLVSFFIPLAVMIFADIRSIQILRTHINFPIVSSSAAAASNESPCRAHATNNRYKQFYKQIKSRQNSTRSVNTNPESIFSVDVERKLAETFSVTSQLTLATITQAASSALSNDMKSRLCRTLPASEVKNTTEALSGSSDSDSPESSTLRNCSSPVRTPTRGCKSCNITSPNEPEIPHGRSRSKSVVYFNMLASCGKTRVNGRERRAEKTLMWVFAAFVALWLPFFCTNLAYGLCGLNCNIPNELFAVFTWLGYLSSGVNPCIYTLLNRDFRLAFKNLLLCRRDMSRSFNNVVPNSVYTRSISNTAV